MRTRIDRFVVVLAVVLALGGCCGGCSGCGMESIPGGFPSKSPDKRTANAGQIRVTQHALNFISSDPAGILGGLLGGGSNMPGVINFPAPMTCTGTAHVCCINNQAVPN